MGFDILVKIFLVTGLLSLAAFSLYLIAKMDEHLHVAEMKVRTLTKRLNDVETRVMTLEDNNESSGKA